MLSPQINSNQHNSTQFTQSHKDNRFILAMSFYLGRHEFVKPTGDTACIIKSVKAYVIGNKELEEEAGGGADCHSQSSGHWIVDTPISTPMSVYEAYKTSRKLWGIDAIGSMIVEITLNNGQF